MKSMFRDQDTSLWSLVNRNHNYSVHYIAGDVLHITLPFSSLDKKLYTFKLYNQNLKGENEGITTNYASII